MPTVLPPTSDTEFWGEDAQTKIINKPEAEFRLNAGHSWMQQGPYLVCKSCVLTHSLYIGMKKQMVGFNDDGTPKLKSVS